MENHFLVPSQGRAYYPDKKGTLSLSSPCVDMFKCVCESAFMLHLHLLSLCKHLHATSTQQHT